MRVIRTMGGLLLFVFLIGALTTGSFAQKASSDNSEAILGAPVPVIVAGTPTCADLNASVNPAFSHITEDWGMRVTRSPAIPFNELYTFVNGPHTQLIGGAAPSAASRLRLAAGGNTLGWLTNRPISAVIVQSALLGANVYHYNPGSFGGFESGSGDGFGLTTPGGCAAIVNVTFCFQSLEPTAAPASVTGRVTDASGGGIFGARLTLTNVQNGEMWTALTNAFGHFTIENVPVGTFYTLTVSHRRFTFANATRTFTLNGDLDGADFVANP